RRRSLRRARRRGGPVCVHDLRGSAAPVSRVRARRRQLPRGPPPGRAGRGMNGAMTRRQKPRKKKGGVGVLRGMRSGVQKVAGAATGGDDDRDAGAPKAPKSKVWSVLGNIVSGALVLAAGAVLLHRCGVLKF